MKKKTNPSTSTPTIEELLKRLKLLEKQNAELEKEKSDMKAKLNWLQEQIRLHQLKRFGTSSEKINPDQLELPLFNEIEKKQISNYQNLQWKRSLIIAAKNEVNVRSC